MTELHRPADLDTLLDRLTLEEQVALLAGADAWTTVPIPRLGIPALKVSDGPAGARGGGALVGGKHTAAFPVGISIGSSWNVHLAHEIGAALALEARDKGAGVLLAPTINVFRSSLGGRNFENTSEDPYLTGRLATAYVQGLQEGGVAATPKHFAGNESEFERGTISSDIPERALRELYLRPFEMVVKAAKPWAIMTAYNRLDGTYCGEHPGLLQDILRREWGFDGLVMSDWGGTHSASLSVRAGLDLEMPGPAKARAGLLSEAQADPDTRQAVRMAARNVLRLLERTGSFEHPRDVSEAAELENERPETRALIRRAGAEGTVLLKNAGGVLPLPVSATVAVIGPNGATAQVMGGGSAQMNAHRRVSPVEGLRAALGEEQVRYAVGCDNDKFLPVPQVPVRIEYRAPGGDEVLAREERPFGEVMWFRLPDGVPPEFRARLSATVHAPEDGHYDFSLASAGLSRLSVDGQALIDNWKHFKAGGTYFGFGSDEQRQGLDLRAGDHRIEVEFSPHHVEVGIAAFSAVRLGFRQPLTQSSVREAAELAASADYAVVCIGTNGEWETEGLDRWGLELPGRQNELVRAVVAANPRTVVLLQTGGPVLTPWLDAVPAALQAWFPGQEAGHSVADVLLGHADPGGRLPQTFPAHLEDDPTHPETPGLQYPGQDGHVAYQEGLYTGYRHVERHGLTPLFPFGFGLSYTTFRLSGAELRGETIGPGESSEVRLKVSNTGTRAGQQVVQLYICDKQASLERPARELKGFVKVNLDVGETRTVTLPLDMRSLAFYDDTRHAWVAEAGEFQLYIGTSSADLPLTLTLTLTAEWSEPGLATPQ